MAKTNAPGPIPNTFNKESSSSYSDDDELMPLPSPAPASTSSVSPVTPDKDDAETIPVIAMSPSFSNEKKKNKLPSLSDEPQLGDVDDHDPSLHAPPMRRELKYPSPSPARRHINVIGKQLGDFHIDKLLGVGAFSKVYLATRDGQLYAIKMLNKDHVESNRRVQQSIDREVGVLKVTNGNWGNHSTWS